ncbi:putative mutT-like protein [Serinicoccus hydrothermalis]|uniref:8-oxo-dGTP diphosphatase n=1 Tax=Serinicoccus hydrothermalis TaxID=1758689 RepID=A0A1B1NG47_9MICO|nr:NUDIX domain-containing protein [Serinicoccus hydrothermalis]ANS80384.1 putative mutT-like protein [Serinicoccus hydrothermalis]
MPVVAAVALCDDLDRPRRVLAGRRSAPPRLAGGWEFPGGKVEEGEDPAHAAVREAQEELGVRVLLGGRVGGEWPLAAPWQMWLWWAVLEPGQDDPRPLEDHDELRWLGRHELGQVAWLEHDLPIVRHLATLLHP